MTITIHQTSSTDRIVGSIVVADTHSIGAFFKHLSLPAHDFGVFVAHFIHGDVDTAVYETEDGAQFLVYKGDPFADLPCA